MIWGDNFSDAAEVLTDWYGSELVEIASLCEISPDKIVVLPEEHQQVVEYIENEAVW